MGIIVYSFIIAALLLFPKTCAVSAKEALRIWGLHIVPSLFPYMVFSKMLCKRIQGTACPAWLACVFLGALGGSPSGAACISTYRTKLSPKNILILFALTGTISPMFFLGTVSLYSNDPVLSRQLLAAQWLGAALAAICVSLWRISPIRLCVKEDMPDLNEDSFTQSIDAMLRVGGCIICFSVIAGLLRLLPISVALCSMIHAMLEISGGVEAMIRSPFAPIERSVLLALFSGFGGLSIIFQNLSFLQATGARLRELLVIAILRGLFAAASMRLLLLL